MPKSSSTTQSLASDKKMSDVALRKKKNADAQAAFRQRRANYIATLEETVTRLEEVVVQLQTSHQEACFLNNNLQQENSRLKHELREREKTCRTLWQTRKTGQAAGSDDPLQLPTYFPSSHSPDGASLNMSKYASGDIEYPINDGAPISNISYEANHNHFAHQRSSPLCPATDAQSSGENISIYRGSKNSPFSCSLSASTFSYPPSGISKESPWPSSIPQSAPSSDSGTDHSAHFVVSPTLAESTSSPFTSDQKVSLNGLNATPYSFPNSRSISPMVSTPSSSSSTLVAPFPLAVLTTTGRDSSDNNRRHSHPHTAEIALFGGTADVSFTGPSGSDRLLHPMLPPISDSDPGSHQEQGGMNSDSVPYLLSRLRIRRELADTRSRSPSPTAPALSSTVAVIKAQAFGALRRTRARTKKTSEGAAKVAMSVLKTRGISTNAVAPAAMPSLKRQRLDDDLNLLMG